MPGVLLVLGSVAVRLPLLDADAYGEGLGLHGDALAVEHGKGVPGGMAGAEDQVAAGQGIGPRRAGNGDARDRAVLDIQVRQLAFKADVGPQVQQLLPQSLQGDVKIVGAHVGLGVIEDLLRRAAFYQLL